MTVTNASKDCMSLGHIVNRHDVAFLVQHFCDLRGSKVAHPNREGQATGICGIDAPVGGISDPKFSTAGCRNYRTQSFISKPKT